MLEVVVLAENVDAARLSDKTVDNTPSNYSLNVSLSEKDRSAEALVLSFTLELTSQPTAARLRVTGNATVKGTRDEIKEAITAPDENRPPPILVMIYERVYSTIYLLAGSIRAPYPMPNLLKKS